MQWFKKIDHRKRKKKADDRLNGFDPENSLAVQSLKKRFGDLNQNELLSIAEVVIYMAENANLKSTITLDREAKRRKSVLLKWFDENFPKLIVNWDIE